MEIQDTSIIVMSFLGSTTECRKILTHSGITDSSKMVQNRHVSKLAALN